jgi:hypothetical protein
VIIAWEATIAARMEAIKPGQKHPGGRAVKNGSEAVLAKKCFWHYAEGGTD